MTNGKQQGGTFVCVLSTKVAISNGRVNCNFTLIIMIIIQKIYSAHISTCWVLKARIQKHGGKPLLFYDKCPGFFYVHYTTHRTYSFTFHPKDKAIMVKCLAQGHKRRDQPGRDSNPHSDNTRTWVQCTHIDWDHWKMPRNKLAISFHNSTVKALRSESTVLTSSSCTRNSQCLHGSFMSINEGFCHYRLISWQNGILKLYSCTTQKKK